jgi:hypothetical protein
MLPCYAFFTGTNSAHEFEADVESVLRQTVGAYVLKIPSRLPLINTEASTSINLHKTDHRDFDRSSPPTVITRLNFPPVLSPNVLAKSSCRLNIFFRIVEPLSGASNTPSIAPATTPASMIKIVLPVFITVVLLLQANSENRAGG